MWEMLKCFQVFKRTLSITGEQIQGLHDTGFLEGFWMINDKAAAKNIKRAISLMLVRKDTAALIAMQKGQPSPMHS